LAAPASFATLTKVDAGRVMARILAQEAYFSLGMAALLTLLERGSSINASLFRRSSRLNLGAAFAFIAFVATVLGYFVLQPMWPAARAGTGAFSFEQLHLFSVSMFVVKLLCAMVLAFRAMRQV
jgi:lysylphosphatidylglycerol synthetase-like protein (DUF2156 family)